MTDKEMLKKIILYICTKYPYKNDLSEARLTKIVYLVDWKFALDHEQALTDIEWIYNHYGPYVPDVIDCAKSCPEIAIEHGWNFYGYPKTIVKAITGVPVSDLDPSIIEVLDLAIKKAAGRSWDRFTQLVYSTYPILTQPRYSKLDLVSLAKEYKINILGKRNKANDRSRLFPFS